MKTFNSFLSFFIFFFLIQVSAFAQQESLTVNDPQRWWGETPGTIEEALISLSPQGVYTEVGLYLTISDRGSFFDPDTQLEIVMDFNLPEGSIIHDSWLWVGDDIIRAKILDKWGANLIYEDIVDRRQDPSILFKTNRNSFQLKVYPLLAGESRKLKISYLVPANWTQEKVLTTLPGNILNLSELPIQDVKLIVWESDDFKAPKISGVDFQAVQDSIFGNYLLADISSPDYENLNHLEYDTPLQNGVYLNEFIDNNERFYQLAVSPNFLFDKNQPKEVMVMFDHDSNNSSITKEQLLASAKARLKEHLTGDDFFNLLKSGLFPQPVADEWLPGDDATIDKAFEDLGALNNYSSLVSVISEGIDFINNSGSGNTTILFFSNTDELESLQVTNDFLNDLQDLMSDSGTPFHVFYYQNKNYNYFWANGQSYTSGHYTYSNLALITGGEFIRTTVSSSLESGIDEILSTLGQPIDFFDFYTTAESGFCHSRYTNIDNQAKVYPNDAIVQVGKYEGDFPFIVKMNGSLNGEIRSKEIVINSDEVWSADSLTREAWTGNQLQKLEDVAITNEDISQIIDISLKERVLSEYTALLCLEPSQGGEPCFDCVDETIISGTDDEIKEASDSLKIEIAPNPFAEQVTITVETGESVKTTDVTCQIFNTVGTLVKSLDSELENNSKLQFHWNGTSAAGSASAGMYIAVIRAGQERKSIKLIYQP